MKIGKFASKNNVTIDTIRHYMTLDLIVPEMNGSQYDFDERCQTDLSEILHFKSIGFSLQEIQTLLIFKRIGRLTGYEKSLYYQSFFKQKMNAINENMAQLEIMKDKLTHAMKRVEATLEKPEHHSVFGIPFSFLSQIACYKCKSTMIMSEGTVIDQRLVKGLLTCTCGTQYTIEEGILIVNSEDLISTHTDETRASFYVEYYIIHTDYEYLNNLYKSFEWAYKNIPFKVYENKTLLELGIGHGFFLRYFYDTIHSSNRYIAVDHDISRLKWLRNSLISNPTTFDLLLIACDFKKIPLHNNAVDVLLDISGSTNYAFDHPEFLLSELSQLYNKECDLIGSYLLFKNFSKNSRIEPFLRDHFKLKPVCEQISKLKFEEKLSYMSNVVTRGGKFEDFFVEGENIFSFICYGKRWG
ncbi:MerR family transcriptional regulator [Fusibacter sp. 3D3]|uniref:MerR family transcriptional regulator n=1 Tax=Fusibacter sp. 3D3 TaxID=1048380 RepID=UPI000852FD45|nr:MerR family transcriptional regulator [Fusibacter sp. 3D3]GAU75821.1 predicted transcriptional regulator LiuR of leucine degradation pathway [Fusibacter sp. 3D3]